MGHILRLKHLNLGVCMWCRELINTCSTRLPTHNHLGLGVLLAPSHCTAETRMPQVSQGFSFITPCPRLEPFSPHKKKMLVCLHIPATWWGQIIEEQFRFLLSVTLISFSSYMACFSDPTWHQAVLINTFLHCSAPAIVSLPSVFDKIGHQMKCFSHWVSAFQQLWFFVKKNPHLFISFLISIFFL